MTYLRLKDLEVVGTIRSIWRRLAAFRSLHCDHRDQTLTMGSTATTKNTQSDLQRWLETTRHVFEERSSSGRSFPGVVSALSLEVARPSMLQHRQVRRPQNDQAQENAEHPSTASTASGRAGSGPSGSGN